MGIIDKLASSLNRRDELPNQQLAVEIADNNDEKGIKELIDNLANKSKAIQSDCIKVLYEIGERKPALISEYIKEFIALLDHKNNRLQWGAMTALDAIASDNPEAIHAFLPKITASANNGSVITKDHAVSILIKLCSVKKYNKNAFGLLMLELQNSPTNQLPMYAEKAIPIINNENKNDFVSTLAARLDEIEKDTKKKHVEKVIKKFS